MHLLFPQTVPFRGHLVQVPTLLFHWHRGSGLGLFFSARSSSVPPPPRSRRALDVWPDRLAFLSCPGMQLGRLLVSPLCSIEEGLWDYFAGSKWCLG